MKSLTPSHPGKILLEEFIEPLGLTRYRVAKDAGIPHPTMTQIVKGRRPISSENALRLGLYFGTGPEFWVNLQADYDLRTVRRKKLKHITKQVKVLQRVAA
jgi:addiction module HigA family antidote